MPFAESTVKFQTYKAQIPSLFSANAVLVASDGVETRIGTLSAGREWFKPWRTTSGERLADRHMPELHVVIEGVFEQRRFLDLVRDVLVFEADSVDVPVSQEKATQTVLEQAALLSADWATI